jgi:hypothetical protein
VSKKSWSRFVFSFSILVLFSACRQQDTELFDEVVFSFSENYEEISVSLYFGEHVKSRIATGTPIKNYGAVFTRPSIGNQHPFEFGFRLQTAIFNDPDYALHVPTRELPNGAEIGTSHPLVQIENENPTDPHLSLYGYVDVLHSDWLGMSGIFQFMDERFFPSDLVMRKVFLWDENGSPIIMASAFGPQRENDGSLKREGGVALFANARALFGTMQTSAKNEIRVSGGGGVELYGPAAPYFQNHWEELKIWEQKLIKGFSLP